MSVARTFSLSPFQPRARMRNESELQRNNPRNPCIGWGAIEGCGANLAAPQPPSHGQSIGAVDAMNVGPMPLADLSIPLCAVCPVLDTESTAVVAPALSSNFR